MKRLTLLLPIAVFGAVLCGWIAARVGRAGRALPSFAPTQPAQFAELAPPLGDAALRGRVVDVDGQPLPGVSLYLRSNSVPFWTVTDAAGRFALEGLAAGEVEVALLVWGRSPRLERVRTGEVELVLPELSPEPLPISAPQSAPLAGRVAHPLRRALTDPEGYEIAFIPLAPANELGTTVERRVRADRQGLFTLDELALGSYEIEVLPSWAAGSSWPNLAAPAYARLEHGRDTGGVVVVLSCGALEASVVDGTGAGLEGALALVHPSDDPRSIWPPVTSDARGRLRLSDLPPGRYAIALRAGEGQIPAQEFEIESGRTTSLELGPVEVRKR